MLVLQESHDLFVSTFVPEHEKQKWSLNVYTTNVVNNVGVLVFRTSADKILGGYYCLWRGPCACSMFLRIVPDPRMVGRKKGRRRRNTSSLCENTCGAVSHLSGRLDGDMQSIMTINDAYEDPVSPLNSCCDRGWAMPSRLSQARVALASRPLPS